MERSEETLKGESDCGVRRHSRVSRVVPQIKQEDWRVCRTLPLHILTLTDLDRWGYLDFSASCFSSLMAIGRSGNTLVFRNKESLT